MSKNKMTDKQKIELLSKIVQCLCEEIQFLAAEAGHGGCCLGSGTKHLMRKLKNSEEKE